MLGWSPEFLPWLRWVVLVVGLAAAAMFLVPRGRRWLAVAVAGALIAGLPAPTAYAAQTALTPRSGPIVTAGPAVTGDDSSGPGGFPGGFPGMSTQRRGGTGSGPGQPFGQEGASTNTALVALLKSTHTKWSAATQSSSGATALELASDTSVIGIGGFSGSDPVINIGTGASHQCWPPPLCPASPLDVAEQQVCGQCAGRNIGPVLFPGQRGSAGVPSNSSVQDGVCPTLRLPSRLNSIARFRSRQFGGSVSLTDFAGIT